MVINGYIHVATMGVGCNLAKQILDQIVSSGLYSLTSRLYIGVVGEDIFKTNLGEIKYFGSLDKYEFPTLQWLQQSESDFVYYFHTKGASVSQERWKKEKFHLMNSMGVFDYEDWILHYEETRKCLSKYLINGHAICAESLKSHDVCGIDWQKNFFPANWWWARVDHIRSLGDLDQSTRYGAEMWIGGKPCRVRDLTDGKPCFARPRYNPIKLL